MTIQYKGRDIEKEILNLYPRDQEDLGEDQYGVSEWIEARNEGYDVEDMLEDFGTGYDEAADYIDENFNSVHYSE